MAINIERTIEEKLNYLKICDLAIEYIKEEHIKILEKQNNIDRDFDFKEVITPEEFKERSKKEKQIKKELEKYTNLERYYQNTRKKIISELTTDKGFLEYRHEYLDKCSI